MTANFRQDALMQFMLAKAATPQGFAVADRPQETTFRAMHNRCDRMVKAGLLFRARAYPRMVRFFTTAEARDAFEVGHPRTPRAAKPVRTIQPHQRIVIRQPYSPPAPRADATIIWPARMPECRMMPDRYAVTVPMQRIGQPGFSMTVGCAA